MIATPITSDLVDGVARLEKVDRGMGPHRLHLHVHQRDADSWPRPREAQPSRARVVVVTGVKHKIFLTAAH